MTRTLGPLCVVIASLAGCSSSNSSAGGAPTKADHLQEVGSMITLYSGKYNRGPAKVGDLAPYENGYPLGYAALKSGEIVVVWGTTMAGEGGGGGSDQVVAYEKKVPTDGGTVLLQNGKVKQMSASEFASAPKAK